MSRKAVKKLSAEDRILWSRVARTVTPLAADRFVPDEEPEPADTKPPPGKARKQTALPVSEQQPPPTTPRSPGALDLKTRGRIAKGRVSLDARVDLHGMTQAEAHGLLLSFLHRAHASGLKHVLVITGKGSSPASEGVLRRAVPAWLATGPFRALVSGHAAAARNHGGDGALYVRLRRKPGEGP
ncbi:MAG: Smr/MutS family protein [Rhizobiaceae bacterium]